jgi:hypothetical protein
MKSLIYNEEHIHNQKVDIIIFIFKKNIFAETKK